MKSPLVRWLFLFNILMLCGLIAFYAQKRNHQARLQQTARVESEAAANEAQESDDTPKIEKARLQQISDTVQAKKAVSDEQLAFLLHEMNKPNPQGDATVSNVTASISLLFLKRPLPTSQKAILYQQLTPELASPDATVSPGITLKQMRELEACDLLAQFDVREAVPQIVPLLDNPKPQIRNDAKKALKKLGYNA